MPRLGYNKSRAGCLRCKQRRVKCDEARPCAACTRHGIRCSLLDVDPAAAESSQGALPIRRSKPKPKSSEDPVQSPDEQSIKQADSLIQTTDPIVGPSEVSGDQSYHGSPVSSPDKFPYFAKFVTGQPLQNPSSWTTDLELMHHYSAFVFLSMPRGLELQTVWQVEIPRLALAYDFLMHQVLALSAYHLAYLHPQNRRRYSILASQHQNEAVKGMRVVLPQQTNENCHAAFATASLLIISAFGTLANPGEAHDDNPDINKLLDVFVLTRGMTGILDAYQTTIGEGPLGQFLALSSHETMNPLLVSVTERLNKLEIPDSTDAEAQALCQNEISMLVQWIALACGSSPDPELRVALTWPTRLAEGYISLLRSRHPAALVVLGYYCIVLHSAGSRFWFVQGWGESILKDASQNAQPGWPVVSVSDVLCSEAPDLKANV